MARHHAYPMIREENLHQREVIGNHSIVGECRHLDHFRD